MIGVYYQIGVRQMLENREVLLHAAVCYCGLSKSSAVIR